MRFISFIRVDSEDVEVLSLAEYQALESEPEIDEYVWQEVPDRITAKSRHFAAMDEWHAHPGADTY